jgi:hypothetical protein
VSWQVRIILPDMAEACCVGNTGLVHPNEGWPCVVDKKLPGKSKDEQMAEKKQELEKRLQDVTGQLGSAKKPPKKGN